MNGGRELIDLKTEIQNFPQIDLVKLSDNHGDLQDNIRNSIMFYNKAVESLKFGSEDIAIIELKKAIQLNRDFHEAINLLGICYLYINDNEKACEMFNKVIEFEKNGIKALQLLDLANNDSIKISPISDKSKQSTVRRMDSIQLGPNRKQLQAKKNSKRLLITGIVIGALFVGTIVGFISVIGAIGNSGNVGNVKTVYTTPDPSVIKELEDIKTQRDTYKAQYEDLQKQMTSQEVQVSNDNTSATDSSNRDTLMEAINFYLQQKPIQSVDLLLTVNIDNLSEKELALYTKLKPDVFEKASDLSYGQAIFSMNKNDFNTAALYYEKVLLYKVASVSATQRSMYDLGKCYMSLGENEKAKAVFTELVTKYPNSGYETFARDRLKQLSGNVNTTKPPATPKTATATPKAPTATPKTATATPKAPTAKPMPSTAKPSVQTESPIETQAPST